MKPGFLKVKAPALLWTVMLVGLGLACTGGAALLGLFFGYSRSLPSVEELTSYHPSMLTRVYDRYDQFLTNFFIERREVVPMESIPLNLRQAVIAVEDSRFLTHRGVDPQGILRALLKNVLAGDVVQGGSTITQQVARALYLSPERRITRKIKEAILAWRLESRFSKEDILWLYLNHIYFGDGAYGVEAAARTYFGKPVSGLDLAECAMLAGLPKAPSTYSPRKHPEAARARLRQVISRMVEEKYLTRESATLALQKPLLLSADPDSGLVAPYFVEYVRQYLERQYGAERLYRGGLRVYTTIDPSMQRAAEEAVREGLHDLDRRRGYRGPETSLITSLPGWIEAYSAKRRDWPSKIEEGKVYPAIVTDVKARERALVRIGSREGVLPLTELGWVNGGYAPPPESAAKALGEGDVIRVRVEKFREGKPLLSLFQEPQVEGALLSMTVPDNEVLAMVGGYDFRRSPFNRAVQARRQPGSSFKPFIYLAALEKGYTPADLINDSPITYENRTIEDKVKKWKPENFDERFYGPIRLREALNHSRNLATIRLLKEVGVRPVINLAGRLGIASPLAPDLSLALGSSSVSLMELTTAYASLPAGGSVTAPLFIRYIVDHGGNLLEIHQARPRKVIDPVDACLLTSMLETVVKNGTGTKVLELGRPVAGKTGTTNEFVDAWFMGFTPRMTTGVWVGLDDEKTLGPQETGSRAAIPIWLEYMKRAVADQPLDEFEISPDVIFVKTDPATGLLAAPFSKDAYFELFRRGTEPTRVANPEQRSSTDFFKMDLDRP